MKRHETTQRALIIKHNPSDKEMVSMSHFSSRIYVKDMLSGALKMFNDSILGLTTYRGTLA